MHEIFLKQALSLAQTRRGFCAPNPAVGAVLVKDNAVIAQGVHMASGEPHAEVVAIKTAGSQAHGATLYLTLEPCCHWGKTPPCTDLIVQSGIAKIIFAYQDPNPAVNGKGHAQCVQAGIDCQHYPLAEVSAFYRPYHYWVTHHRPWITSKMAITFDGKIALQSGKPVALTGKKLAEVTHQGRYHSDAIITTVRTIINDDPAFNVRLPEQAPLTTKPLYILDTHARLPVTAKVLQSCDDITVFHGRAAPTKALQALATAGIKSHAITESAQGLDLPEIIQVLAAAGYHQCWVEAGGKLFQSLYTQQLLQQLLVYLSAQTLAQSGYDAFAQAIDFRTAKTVAWTSLGEEAYCEVCWE